MEIRYTASCIVHKKFNLCTSILSNVTEQSASFPKLHISQQPAILTTDYHTCSLIAQVELTHVDCLNFGEAAGVRNHPQACKCPAQFIAPHCGLGSQQLSNSHQECLTQATRNPPLKPNPTSKLSHIPQSTSRSWDQIAPQTSNTTPLPEYTSASHTVPSHC